jgi:hypothetical protein
MKTVNSGNLGGRVEMIGLQTNDFTLGAFRLCQPWSLEGRARTRIGGERFHPPYNNDRVEEQLQLQ